MAKIGQSMQILNFGNQSSKSAIQTLLTCHYDEIQKKKKKRIQQGHLQHMPKIFKKSHVNTRLSNLSQSHTASFTSSNKKGNNISSLLIRKRLKKHLP